MKVITFSNKYHDTITIYIVSRLATTKTAEVDSAITQLLHMPRQCCHLSEVNQDCVSLRLI